MPQGQNSILSCIALSYVCRMRFSLKSLDWFLPALAFAVLLAWRFPAPGAAGGWLHPEWLTKLGVALIFFLHGLLLPLQTMKAGMLHWRLHALVQSATFLIFPLIGTVLYSVAAPWIGGDLALGFFYLCALPSTVSSSVALTAAARGNVSGALFNATLSGLLGVALTPLWVGWLVGQENGAGMALGAVMLDLATWLLLPLAAGQLLRPWLGVWASAHKKQLTRIDRAIILLLIYTSFCDSMQSGVWGAQSPLLLLGAGLVCMVLFGAIFWLTALGSDGLGFPPEDRIAAIFCGSKKSLAQGIPMAHLIFGATPSLGLILLPILLYHPLQLVICSWLAGKWARRDMAAPSSGLA